MKNILYIILFLICSTTLYSQTLNIEEQTDRIKTLNNEYKIQEESEKIEKILKNTKDTCNLYDYVFFRAEENEKTNVLYSKTETYVLKNCTLKDYIKISKKIFKEVGKKQNFKFLGYTSNLWHILDENFSINGYYYETINTFVFEINYALTDKEKENRNKIYNNSIHIPYIYRPYLYYRGRPSFYYRGRLY